ncbi:hypothetical protein AALC16_23640 [Lachnospiraceae bacterium 29-91]
MLRMKPSETWEQKFSRLSYEWEKTYAYGNPDSMCTDGILLNRIRQELLKTQQELEENGTSAKLLIPPKMQEGYVACADQIRIQAQSAVKEYLASEEYRYVLTVLPKLSPKQKRETGAAEVYGKVQSLVDALEEDNLVVLREAISSGMLTGLIQEIARKLQELPLRPLPEKEKAQKEQQENWKIQGQMSIYDLAAVSE